MSDAVPIVIYTCTECHLCDKAGAAVRKIVDEANVTTGIDLVNVDSNEGLHEEYGKCVLYAHVGGRPAFKLYIDADRLGEKLMAARE